MKSPRAFGRSLILKYRRLPNRAKAFIWIFVLVVGVIILPSVVSQELHRNKTAQLYFTVPTVQSQQIAVGSTFPVELRVQTGGEAINAVGTTIQFNPLYLEVVNMTTDKSFCYYYLDNTFDNIKGEVKISCGGPNPGFTGDSLVVHLNMRAKTLGETKITVDPATTTVLANDSKGSNILKDKPELPLKIIQYL